MSNIDRVTIVRLISGFFLVEFQREIKEKHFRTFMKRDESQQFFIDGIREIVDFKLEALEAPVPNAVRVVNAKPASTSTPASTSMSASTSTPASTCMPAQSSSANVVDDWRNVIVKEEYEEYEINEQHMDYQPIEPKAQPLDKPEPVESQVPPVVVEKSAEPQLPEVEPTQTQKLEEPEMKQELVDVIIEEHDKESTISESRTEQDKESTMSEPRTEPYDSESNDSLPVHGPDLYDEELEIESILSRCSDGLKVKPNVKRKREREEAKRNRIRTLVLKIPENNKFDDASIDLLITEYRVSPDGEQIEVTPAAKRSRHGHWTLENHEPMRNIQYKCELCPIISR